MANAPVTTSGHGPRLQTGTLPPRGNTRAALDRAVSARLLPKSRPSSRSVAVFSAHRSRYDYNRRCSNTSDHGVGSIGHAPDEPARCRLSRRTNHASRTAKTPPKEVQAGACAALRDEGPQVLAAALLERK